MKHICPVCCYPMDEPADDYNICSSCGTEFGLHDQRFTHQQLRAAWQREGAKWWSTFDNQPANWDPAIQLGGLYPQPTGEQSMNLYAVGSMVQPIRGNKHHPRKRRRPVVQLRQQGLIAIGAR